MEYHGGCANRNDGAFGEIDALFHADQFVHVKSPRARRAIAQDKEQASAFRAAHLDGAVCFVHTRVHRLEGGFGFSALYVTADAVFTFVKGDDLAKVEGVFQNNEISHCRSLLRFRRCAERGGVLRREHFPTYANLKLFAAGRALKYEGATGSIERIVEQNGFVAFRTADSFHGGGKKWGNNR